MDVVPKFAEWARQGESEDGNWLNSLGIWQRLHLSKQSVCRLHLTKCLQTN